MARPLFGEYDNDRGLRAIGRIADGLVRVAW